MEGRGTENERLETWQQIAGHLDVSVRAAQYFEKKYGLPVYRKPGRKGQVYAYNQELDEWRDRSQERVAEAQQAESPEHHLGSEGPEAVAPVGPSVSGPVNHAPQPQPARRLHLALAAALLLIAGAAVWIWMKAHETGPSASFKVSGRTLMVYDADGREKWRYEFDHFNRPDDPPGPTRRILISDFDGDSRPEVLFIHFASDEKGAPIADGNAELYCFRDDGKLLWHKKFGTPFLTARGRPVPDALYEVYLLGRLRKPRADGGLIVAGGPRGGTGVFQVAIYTATGEVVGVYTHPGWLWAMTIADLDEDGDEEIILGGVNNAYLNNGSGATIVAIRARDFAGRWQGAVPEGQQPWARGWESGKEAAVLIIDEVAPDPDAHKYCRVSQFIYGGGVLEAKITGSADPLAFFYFDRRLRLTSVQPELNFGSKLLERFAKPVPIKQGQQFFLKELGKIKYLRNKLDPERAAENSPDIVRVKK